MSIIEVLEEKLLGNFYTRLSCGDTFDLHFDGFWLITQNVISSDERVLNMLIAGYRPGIEAVDKESVAKNLILTTTLRKKITDVSISSDSWLELSFENGVKLHFPTDTEVVDWHWALNENGQDPYHDFIVGVLESGDVQLGK